MDLVTVVWVEDIVCSVCGWLLRIYLLVDFEPLRYKVLLESFKIPTTLSKAVILAGRGHARRSLSKLAARDPQRSSCLCSLSTRVMGTHMCEGFKLSVSCLLRKCPFPLGSLLSSGHIEGSSSLSYVSVCHTCVEVRGQPCAVCPLRPSRGLQRLNLGSQAGMAGALLVKPPLQSILFYFIKEILL